MTDDALTVPAPKDAFEAVMADGAAIRVRRHGNPAGPRLVLSHGNGFAIDAYRPFWRLLEARYDLVLYDQRNHGANPRHDVARHDVPTFVEDLDRLIAAIPARWGAKPTAGLFHSISAVTAIWHALEHGWRWDALALVDPPLIPSPGHPLHGEARGFELGLSQWAAGRPDRFADPAELAARFARSRSLAGWVPGAHALMARAITRPDPERAGWMLSCPREAESRVYATNAGLDLCPRLGELRGPLILIGSDPDDARVRAPGRVGRAMHAEHGLAWAPILGTTHMLQIERPEAAAAALEAFLAAQGLNA